MTEARRAMFRLAMAMYVGETCRYCGHEYTSIEDIQDQNVVWAHHKDTDPPITSKGQSLACQDCYNRAKATA